VRRPTIFLGQAKQALGRETRRCFSEFIYFSFVALPAEGASVAFMLPCEVVIPISHDKFEAETKHCN
jgi:hypothetical protein